MECVVKQEILDLIKTDGVLLEKVAKTTGWEFATVLRKLQPNNNKLTKIGTLKVIALHLGKGVEELIEEKELASA